MRHHDDELLNRFIGQYIEIQHGIKRLEEGNRTGFPEFLANGQINDVSIEVLIAQEKNKLNASEMLIDMRCAQGGLNKPILSS